MTTRDYDDIVGVTVYCDECEIAYTGDYRVPAGRDSLDVARDHMATQGWYITKRHDLCPKCAPDVPVHVLPVNDLIEHADNDECVCVPTIEPVKRDDGSVGWLIIHHSLDNREAWERFFERRRNTISNPLPPSIRQQLIDFQADAVISGIAGAGARRK